MQALRRSPVGLRCWCFCCCAAGLPAQSWILISYQTHGFRIFPSPYGLPFPSLDGSLGRADAFSATPSHWFISAFAASAFGVESVMSWPSQTFKAGRCREQTLLPRRHADGQELRGQELLGVTHRRVHARRERGEAALHTSGRVLQKNTQRRCRQVRGGERMAEMPKVRLPWTKTGGSLKE